MSARNSKRPKARSIEGQRLKRRAQRAALHDAVHSLGEFMASNGIGSESNDWHMALDAARTSLPVDDSRPLALALVAAAYVVDLNGQRTTKTGVKVHTLAAGVVGNPVPLWVFYLYQSDPSWVMQFGSHEMNVNNEACKSVAEHPEWAVARAAASLHLVASRAVSQALSECVAQPIVGDDTTAQDLLVGEVGRFAEALAKDLGVPWKAGEGDKQPTTLDEALATYGELVNTGKTVGAFPWDEVLAKHLEAIGATGREAAQLVRNASRETMAAVLDGSAKVGEHAGPGAMLRQWNDPSSDPLGARWITNATVALWHDRVKARAEQATTPVRAHGHKGYSKIPKVVAGMAWAVEGPPMERTVDVDGVSFGLEPRIAQRVAEGRVLVPRGLALMPSDKRPHQAAFPFEYDSDADTLPMALTQASSAGVLSIDAFKAILLAFANANVIGGELIGGTLSEWTAQVRPYLKRTQARDYQQVARGFHEADGIRVYLPDGSDLRPFDVRRPTDPEKPERDAEVRMGLTQTFRETLSASFGDTRYRGEFLLDLSGAMALHGFDGARRLRLYTTTAAHWGAAFHADANRYGEFNPDMMQARSLEEWGVLANALSSAGVELLRGNTKRGAAKTALSNDRRYIADDMEYLVSAGMFGGIEKQGDSLKPLPPDAHQEAFRAIRRRGSRPGK